VISDNWPGLEKFFVPGREILVAATCGEVLDLLAGTSERQRDAIAAAARARVLASHTAMHRASELEGLLKRCTGRRPMRLASA
jgi:spore maturation protein CgeB